MKTKKNTNSIAAETPNDYFATRVSKLACGKSFTVPNYGTVNAYRNKSGKRMFSVSDSNAVPNGGNLKPITVINEIRYGLDFLNQNGVS